MDVVVPRAIVICGGDPHIVEVVTTPLRSTRGIWAGYKHATLQPNGDSCSEL